MRVRRTLCLGKPEVDSQVSTRRCRWRDITSCDGTGARQRCCAIWRLHSDSAALAVAVPPVARLAHKRQLVPQLQQHSSLICNWGVEGFLGGGALPALVGGAARDEEVDVDGAALAAAVRAVLGLAHERHLVRELCEHHRARRAEVQPRASGRDRQQRNAHLHISITHITITTLFTCYVCRHAKRHCLRTCNTKANILTNLTFVVT